MRRGGTGRIERTVTRGTDGRDDESVKKKQETRTARTIGTMAGTRTAAQTGREDRRWEGDDNKDGRGILRRRQRTGTGTTTTTSEGKAGGPKRISNINISKIKNIYYSTTEVNKVIVSSVVL